MGNVAGEQGLALQQHFPHKFPYSFKTSDCHKISSFNDVLKFGHHLIFSTCFFHFWHLFKFMKSRSHDGLATKGLFNFKSHNTISFHKVKPFARLRTLLALWKNVGNLYASVNLYALVNFCRSQPDFEGFLRALRFPPSSKLTPSLI